MMVAAFLLVREPVLIPRTAPFGDFVADFKSALAFKKGKIV